MRKIRVLVVDDSILARQMIISDLNAHPQIEVVGYAINASDARNKVKQLSPDVMTLDVEMPGMSGIQFLKELLPVHPLPVILVSSLNLRVFDALEAGAVDFVRKPGEGENREHFLTTLCQKVIVASTARVRMPRASARPAAAAPVVPAAGSRRVSPPSARQQQVIIGLGASTGGTEATLAVLRQLPKDTPGIVVVQHMPAGFTKMYAERLNRLCQMEVREAVSGDEIHPGLVLIAPAGVQTKVVRMRDRYTVACQPGEKVSGHCPSVDYLFHSMASSVKCRMVGIIMTGMGKDGAEGLLAMRKAGAFTIGQDQDSCVVYGMPMEAYKLGAVTVQASCEAIAGTLTSHLKKL